MNTADLPTRARAALAYLQSVTSRKDLCSTVRTYIETLEKQVSDLRFIIEKRDEIAAEEKRLNGTSLFRRFWNWLNSRRGGH